MTKTPEELTAEWKAGKLESGLYWVKFKGKIVIAECAVFGDVSKPFKIKKKTDFIIKISKVLAPCNYDEYKAMQKELAEHRHYCCCEKNEVMRLKLAEMEELLKECKKYIDFCCVPDGFGKSYIAEELLTRINTILGESEGK